MRTLVYDTLLALYTPTEVGTRVYGTGQIPDSPQKPFVAFNFLTSDAERYSAVAALSDAELQPVQVFVYDHEGSYIRVDALIRKLEGVVKALAGSNSSTGARCLWSSWGGISQDFKAPEYEAAARFATFSITGSHHKEEV